jgi:predicted Zn-dependent peptidase
MGFVVPPSGGLSAFRGCFRIFSKGSRMIRIRTLPNGICVVTEPIEAVRSCGIGLWVEVGSRYELPGEEGLSHFIEHMLFKGTRERNVRQIGDTINYLGGNINAYTSQEMVCLHARTVDRKAHEALDLLGEMLMESTFPATEIKRERQVVLEEYKMVEDNPENLSVDVFLKNLWPTWLTASVTGACPIISKNYRMITSSSMESWGYLLYMESRSRLIMPILS